jgi:hypothetical protein
MAVDGSERGGGCAGEIEQNRGNRAAEICALADRHQRDDRHHRVEVERKRDQEADRDVAVEARQRTEYEADGHAEDGEREVLPLQHQTKRGPEVFDHDAIRLGDDIDRARPGLMSVLLGYAHVERIVAAALEVEGVGLAELPRRIDIRETENPQPAAEAAQFHDLVVNSDVRDCGPMGDEFGHDVEVARHLILEPKIET